MTPKVSEISWQKSSQLFSHQACHAANALKISKDPMPHKHFLYIMMFAWQPFGHAHVIHSVSNPSQKALKSERITLNHQTSDFIRKTFSSQLVDRRAAKDVSAALKGNEKAFKAGCLLHLAWSLHFYFGVFLNVQTVN